MSDHSSNQPDLSAHFHKLNMSAQPFVPNAHAPTFQPGGGGNYGRMYGGGGAQYHMGQNPPRGMYPTNIPYIPQGYGGGGGSGGYMQGPPHGGGGVPYQQHQPQQGRPPLHQMNPHSHVNPSDYAPNRGHPKTQQQYYQPQPHHNIPGGNVPQQPTGRGAVPQSHGRDTVPQSHAMDTVPPPARVVPEIQQPLMTNSNSTIKTNTNASPTPPSTQLGLPLEEPPVDSWEDITVTEDQPTPSSTTPGTTKPVQSNEPMTKPTDTADSGSSTPSIDTPSEQREQATIKVEKTTSSDRKASKEANNVSNNSNGSSINDTMVVSKAAKIPQPVLKKKEDEKENVNIVFIGHVDAGKSTIGGHLMYLTGQVDKRTLEKYEKEAKEKNRETWYLSWALDTNQEERDKGKTVDVGRGSFESEKKRFTILDAPGHAGFVPNMISGTVQADVGILVISARRGEFETGFERRGQTREHAMLAKTAGVKHLVILVNKMDDPTVGWDESRYEEIKAKLTPFLKKVGFNPKTDIHYIPVSGLIGANLKTPAVDSCPWYKGPPFLTYLDDLPPINREDAGPLRIPIIDKHKDMGTIVLGKVESGSVGKGSTLIVMPNRSQVEVLSVMRDEDEVDAAFSGDNIKLKLKGIEEEDVSPGFVLCPPLSLCHSGRVFDGQVVILEYKSIICAGFSCVIHIHTVVEVVEILSLIARIDKKTGKRIPEKPKFIKQDHTAIAKFQSSGVICMETFKDFAPMARFTLRDEGKTIAIGKVLKIVE